MYPTKATQGKSELETFLRTSRSVNVASCESVWTFASNASQRGRKYAVMWGIWDIWDIWDMWDMWINAHLSSTQSWTEEMRNAKLVRIVSLKEDLGSPQKK